MKITLRITIDKTLTTSSVNCVRTYRRLCILNSILCFYIIFIETLSILWSAKGFVCL